MWHMRYRSFLWVGRLTFLFIRDFIFEETKLKNLLIFALNLANFLLKLKLFISWRFRDFVRLSSAQRKHVEWFVFATINIRTPMLHHRPLRVRGETRFNPPAPLRPGEPEERSFCENFFKEVLVDTEVSSVEYINEVGHFSRGKTRRERSPLSPRYLPQSLVSTLRWKL